MITIEMQRTNGAYGFEAKDEMGHLIQTDSSAGNGGNDSGFTPMQLLLAALGGCSAIDIVSILQKQKQVIDGFRMKIEGKREENKQPALWKTIHISFELMGDIDLAKAKRAADLSMDKYCSVTETLRRAGAEITWSVQLNAA